MSPLERLVLIQDQEIKLAKSAKLEFFLDLPDQWYDPEPVYGCENAHISKRYLKSEKNGAVCLECHEPLVMLPPHYTEELLRSRLDSVDSDHSFPPSNSLDAVGRNRTHD